MFSTGAGGVLKGIPGSGVKTIAGIVESTEEAIERVAFASEKHGLSAS